MLRLILVTIFLWRLDLPRIDAVLNGQSCRMSGCNNWIFRSSICASTAVAIVAWQGGSTEGARGSAEAGVRIEPLAMGTLDWEANLHHAQIKRSAAQGISRYAQVGYASAHSSYSSAIILAPAVVSAP